MVLFFVWLFINFDQFFYFLVRDCSVRNGGCEDKCDDTGAKHECKCTAIGNVLGEDGTSCGMYNCHCFPLLTEYFSLNKFIKTFYTKKYILGTIFVWLFINFDPFFYFLVRDCSVKNGGCKDKCDGTGAKHECICTAIGKVLGEDGTSCGM